MTLNLLLFFSVRQIADEVLSSFRNDNSCWLYPEEKRETTMEGLIGFFVAWIQMPFGVLQDGHLREYDSDLAEGKNLGFAQKMDWYVQNLIKRKRRNIPTRSTSESYKNTFSKCF